MIAILGGLIVPCGPLAAYAQSAQSDGSDLPCNDLCRAWMGQAYSGSRDDEVRPAAQAEDQGPSTQVDAPDPDTSGLEKARPEQMRSEREPRRVTVQSRRMVPSDAEDSLYEQPRKHWTRRQADARPHHRSGKAVPALVEAPPPDQKRTTSSEHKEAPGPGPQAIASSDEPAARLDPEARVMTLSLDGKPGDDVRLTAEQADRLVRTIGDARAKMQPPPQQNWAFGQTVSAIYDPRWTTEPDRSDGNTLLHIRDPRFGWLHYTVPRTTAQQLGTLLKKQAALPASSNHRAEATP